MHDEQQPRKALLKTLMRLTCYFFSGCLDEVLKQAHDTFINHYST